METKKLAIILVAFSFLFWFDYFVSIGQPEINPLYSPTNKLIFFPIIISSVLVANHLHETRKSKMFSSFFSKSIKPTLAFLVGLFAFAMIWNAPVLAQSNGGFETTNDSVSNYCAIGFLQCGSFPLGNAESKVINLPSGWTMNAFNGTNEITGQVDVFDVRSGYSSQGSKALTLWYQPPSSCGYNVQTGACENTSIGVTSLARSPVTTLENASLELRYDSSVSNFYPLRDSDNHYGITCSDGTDNKDESTCVSPNSPLSITAYLRVRINVNGTVIELRNGVEDISLPSGASFVSNVIDLEPFLTSESFPINATVEFVMFVPDYTADTVRSVTLDNVRIVAKSVTPSPAEAYIEDMTTLSDFGLDAKTIGCSGSCSASDFPNGDNVPISVRFDGAGIVNLTTRATLTVAPNQAVVTGVTNINALYSNGTSLQLLNASRVTAEFTPNQQYWEFPIWDTDNLVSITGSGSFDYLVAVGGDITQTWSINLTSQLKEIRQFYDPAQISNSRETLAGEPFLYPIITYDHIVLGNKTHVFKLFNFAGTSFTSKVLLELRDGDGNLKDKATHTVGVSPFGSTLTSNNWLTDQTLAIDDVVTATYSTEENVVFVSDIPSTFSSNSTTTFLPLQTNPFSSCQNYCGLPDGNFCFFVGEGEDRLCDGTTHFTSFTIGSESCGFIETSENKADFDVCSLELQEIGVVEGATGFGVNNTEAILGLQSSFDDAGLGFLGFLVTPISIVFFVILGISAYLEMKIRTFNGVIFLGSLLSMILIVTFFGIFPVEVALLIIIIAGAMLVHQVRGMIGGNTNTGG